MFTPTYSIERAMHASLVRKNDARQIEHGQDPVPDTLLRLPEGALQDEDRLEDDGVGDPNANLAPLGPAEVGRGSRRLVGIVAEEVAQDDVGVEEGEVGHRSFPRSTAASAIASAAASRSSSAERTGPVPLNMPAVRATTLP